MQNDYWSLTLTFELFSLKFLAMSSSILFATLKQMIAVYKMGIKQKPTI